jgi:hypothetical protein
VTMSDDNKYEVLKEEERSMEDSVARTSDRDFIVEGSEDVDDVDILTLGAGARVPSHAGGAQCPVNYYKIHI